MAREQGIQPITEGVAQIARDRRRDLGLVGDEAALPAPQRDEALRPGADLGPRDE